MKRGYVSLWRKSLDSIVWKNPKLWRFWTWCLLKATHVDYRQVVGFQEVDLKIGEFIFGRKKCSEETGLSERTIRTCIKKLNAEKLTIKTTNKYSIISIMNFEPYQNPKTKSDHQNDHLTTTNNNINNIIVNYLNEKTGKKYKTTTPKTIRLIKTRLKEGFSIDDFKTVIKNKTKEWKNTDMAEYLRPETLFGTKFEGYLQSVKSTKKLYDIDGNELTPEKIKEMRDG